MLTITAGEETKESYSKENSLGEIPLGHDINSNSISREEDTKDTISQPSPEFLNQLNRIGELPKQYDDVAVQVSLLRDKKARATVCIGGVFLETNKQTNPYALVSARHSNLKHNIRTVYNTSLRTETQSYAHFYVGINDV